MKIINRKARFNYEILEKAEAGISLTGEEVKAIKNGKLSLDQAYVKIIGQQAFLINANIAGVDQPTRSRKLLLHKKQIISFLSIIKAKKLTLIPLKVYTKGQLIKVEIALAKSKKRHSKKESLKKRDLEREIQRELKGT